MFDEPINHVSARIVLRAFPTWGEAETTDDLEQWISERLARATWSSTEMAVLHLAAGLVGIAEYEVVRLTADDGTPVKEHRRVPVLGDMLSASFDDCRESHVLAALELAVLGERPARWYWVSEGL